MFGNLQQVTDDELLNFVMLILARSTTWLTARDMTELDEIETEFMRRGTLCGEQYDA